MKNKYLIPILLLIILISSGVSGYFLGISKNSIKKNGPTTLDEIFSYLEEYHYSKPQVEELYLGALNGALDGLNDKYTYLIEPEDKNGYIGLTYTKSNSGYHINDVYFDSPFYNILYKFDLIEEINGKNVNDLTDDDFLSLTKLNVDDNISFKINRLGHNFVVEKKAINKTISYSKKLNEETGYIYLSNFTTGSSDLFYKNLIDIESDIDLLLIDLRNNGGGNLEELTKILSYFIKNNGKPYMSMDLPDGNKEYFTTSNNTKKPYDIKVLVNGYTASAAEAFASIMNEYMGYDLIGTKTYGKGVYQNVIPLKTMPGYYINCTIGYWYTPSGNTINNIGITPNIIVDSLNYSLIDLFDVEVDSVTNTTKNFTSMINIIYDLNLRSDGYFDLELQNYLLDNYNSDKITYEIYYDVLSRIYEENIFDKLYFSKAGINYVN